MAHLWVKNGSDEWAVLPLEADALSLATNPPRAVGWAPDASVRENSGVVLMRVAKGDEAAWVLICGRAREVRVNGVAVALGVRAVADRDEISVGRVGTFYFSTESLARVEEFPGAAQALYCPRCKLAVEQKTPAVKCPRCGVWYHQSEELPCWAYAETCALCPQTTDTGAGFRWTPEGL